MNIFQLFGDLLHIVAVLMLLVKICITRNCAGISGQSQILYTIIYTTRFLLMKPHFWYYNTNINIFFLGASILTVFLIHVVFRKTYDADNDQFLMEMLIIIALFVAVIIHYDAKTREILWAFSVYLEAVAILPQLYLISKIPYVESTAICYLSLLGSYSAFRIIKSISRYYVNGNCNVVSLASAIVQTSFYILYLVGCLIKHHLSSTKAGQYYQENIVAVVNVEPLSEKTEDTAKLIDN